MTTQGYSRFLVAMQAVLLLAIGCSGERRDQTTSSGTSAASSGEWALADLREIASPTGEDAGEPFLQSSPDGTVVLSWMEKKGAAHELRFSTLRGGSWWQPAVVQTSEKFFVNWADTPSVVRTAGGTLFAHWLQKSADGKYTYDVHVTSSTDGGKSWRPSVVPHQNPNKSEYGFVSMLPAPDREAVSLLWLDGRNMKEEGIGDMALRTATLDSDGTLSADHILDPRVCECCQTGMTRTAQGLVAVYRNRSEDEIRDTGIVRESGGAWTAPSIVHPDGWTIPGCPVNGPQIDAHGANVALAWFTAADDRPRVQASFSGDSGAKFASPFVISDSDPLGRVDVVMLGDNLAAVSWLERVGNEGAVMVQLVSPKGKVGKAVETGRTSASRKSGFPRMAARGEEVIIAWTGTEEKPRVHVATASLKRP